LYNLGYEINASRVVRIIIGGIFAVMGNYLGRIRFNYFVGIRTPWTLANEEVWRRTHRFAGPVWFFCGLAALVCAFLPGALASILVIVILAVAVVVPIVYSYLAFAKSRTG
ncbi:MAG: SdpI family protein, partial [Tumebacillaceae bacterium]